jgi:hypothetical protein
MLHAGFVEVERKVQKSYWEEHSRDLTVESMMLDSRAKDLDKEERPEVLQTLIHTSMLGYPCYLFLWYAWQREK